MPLHSPNWTDPPRQPEAPAPPLQIWRLRLGDLDGDPEDTLRSLTVPAEHRQARRYAFAADRHRHLAGRAVARLALARRYGCRARDLSITEGPHGKPQLRQAPSDEPVFHFNIAHTKDVVVVAVSRTHPVGIDIEARRRDANVEALAERVLTEAEQSWWRARPEAHQREAFIHLWTCKEAFLKATGQGLQRALHTIECRFDGDVIAAFDDAEEHTPQSLNTSAARWAVWAFSASEGVAGAVVHTLDPSSPADWIDAVGLVNGTSDSG